MEPRETKLGAFIPTAPWRATHTLLTSPCACLTGSCAETLRPITFSYVNDTPEAQGKLQDCFTLTTHPTLLKGRLPVQLQLCTPYGKRLATTTDWAKFQEREWPKHRQAVAEKFSGVLWR